MLPADESKRSPPFQTFDAAIPQKKRRPGLSRAACVSVVCGARTIPSPNWFCRCSWGAPLCPGWLRKDTCNWGVQSKWVHRLLNWFHRDIETINRTVWDLLPVLIPMLNGSSKHFFELRNYRFSRSRLRSYSTNHFQSQNQLRRESEKLRWLWSKLRTALRLNSSRLGAPWQDSQLWMPLLP